MIDFKGLVPKKGLGTTWPISPGTWAARYRPRMEPNRHASRKATPKQHFRHAGNCSFLHPIFRVEPTGSVFSFMGLNTLQPTASIFDELRDADTPPTEATDLGGDPRPGLSCGERSVTANGFEPLLSADEAAEYLRIHVKTLQKLAREQRVPCVRMGKYWRFRLSSLDRWIAVQENQTSQPLRVE